MNNEKSVFNTNNYGKIVIKLEKYLKDNNISKNKLATLTGLTFTSVQRYCKGKNLRVDLDILSRMCYVLGCKLEDLIEYKK